MSERVTATQRETERLQALAARPTSSAWVSANAGTGKTHVLTMRILRLLLAGVKPERILALTFTKTAAAEMSTRLFDTLARWVTHDTDGLAQELAKLTGAPADDTAVLHARTLFAAAIETPVGLKVQTIHAFCERLLQRFPIEAGVPPNFKVLDDLQSNELVRLAIDQMLEAAVGQPGSALHEALMTVIAHAADESFDTVLSEAIAEPDWIAGLMRLELDNLTGFRAIDRLYRRAAGVRRQGDVAAIDAEREVVIDDATMRDAIQVLTASDKPTDQSLGAALSEARSAQSQDVRIAALAKALLTDKGEPRADSQFGTKLIKETRPDIVSALHRARDRFHTLSQERIALVAIEATIALVRLADDVLGRFTAMKARRAGLDYDDLIRKTAGLLGGQRTPATTSVTQWVLYKLDGGLDHILVDEAQDTSPEQWDLVRALTAEFYADQGAGAAVRTLFAVGDEKQSIFGFQGAAPEMFAAMGHTFESTAKRARLDWQRVPLTLSFRTAAPVLQAVDHTFADPARTPGLMAHRDSITHQIHRAGQAGLVEIWPTEKPDKTTPAEPWQPLDDVTATAPATRLAERIAATIEHWINNGEILPSQGRPVRAGDIMVLVRKRRPMAPALVSALKNRGIEVAGADRLRLTDALAVEDLLALGDVLVLPEDDLALAAVLKSPLFGLDDMQLLEIANGRKGSLWSALLKAAREGHATFREAAETLKQWRAEADYAPPYEFFARILERNGGRLRRAILQRLGPDAADPLDEFLNFALNYDSSEPPSLQGFLSALRDVSPEIKRDMDQGRNEIRVMTVHGAKGLEAPIVILADTCANPIGHDRARLVAIADTVRPRSAGGLFMWPAGGARTTPVVAKAIAERQARGLAESNRLLYVAMTRARDRLYIAGAEAKTKLPTDCWYAILDERLKALVTPAQDYTGAPVLRYACPQTAAPDGKPDTTAAVQSSKTLPEWSATRAAAEPRRAVPLAPSRLAAYETDDDGEVMPPPRDANSAAPPLPPGVLADDARFLRGTLTHALLEHLPSVPRPTWRAAGTQFVAQRGAALKPRVRASIIEEVLAIMETPEFAPLFGPAALAEVPLAAELTPPTGRGAPLRITGQIDRLAITDHEVLIVDYKTNRPPPLEPTKIAEVYIFQLAAYRMVLRGIFPGRAVRAAILWTDGARLMPIPTELLDHYETLIWERGGRELDGSANAS
jgi:ATP-dependent helicase/nuclease subunit A